MRFISPYRLLRLTIYQQYIAHTIMRYIGLIAFGLVSLFFIFDLLSESNEIGNGKYTFNLIVLFSILKIPAQFYDVIPIAVVAGAIVGLASLANGSEITVLRAAGMRPKQLLYTLFLTGIPFVLFTLVIGEWIQPLASTYTESLRAKMLGNRIHSQLKTGLWLRDTASNGHIRFLNIPTISGDHSIPLMWIYQFDSSMRLIQRSQALYGYFQTYKVSNLSFNQQSIDTTAQPSDFNLLTVLPNFNKQSFWLFNTIYTEYYSPDTAQIRSFDTQLQWKWDTNLTIQSLIGLQKNPERVGVFALLNTVIFQMNNRLDSSKSLSILLRRCLYPLALWVMLMIALPFAYLRARGSTITVHIFSGVLLGMGFHAGNRLFEFMSLSQGWPIWLTAQLPLWIGILTALILFWRFHRLH